MSESTIMTRVRAMLGIATGQTDKLTYICESTEDRLLMRLDGAETLPTELEHIVVEIAIARFNRIGSEGLDSHTVEGESYQFTDDDFAPFENEIQLWLSANDSVKGKVTFI